MKNIFFSLIALLVVNTLAFAQTAVFKAGAFAQDISPEELPISINGNMKDGKATMVHDRIHARCIVLDDGGINIFGGFIVQFVQLRAIATYLEERIHFLIHFLDLILVS